MFYLKCIQRSILKEHALIWVQKIVCDVQYGGYVGVGGAVGRQRILDLLQHLHDAKTEIFNVILITFSCVPFAFTSKYIVNELCCWY